MYFLYIPLLLFLFRVSAMSTPREVLWGSVAFTRNGETVPYGLPGALTLTPVGAHQLAGAGHAFRNRYLTPSSNPSLLFSKIQGLSHSLNNDELEISSTPDQNVAASAQAFMQGLYPPSMGLSEPRGLPSNMADTNGTLIDYPLNGYQYPLISTYRPEDPMSAHISGHRGCPKHTEAVRTFSSTKVFQDLFERTASFYGDMYSRMLFSVYSRDMASVLHAPIIYEYLNYQYTHNSTAQGIISSADVEKARQYANEWAHATSSGADVSWSKDRILAIGGRSLAHTIVLALQRNERSQGSSNKLSLIFGGYETMMAFIEIAISAHHRENLNGIPNYGASIVIDLFSVEEDGPVDYPSSDSELMVRFLLRNGTDASDSDIPFIAYPMFGNSLHQTAMPYKDFVSKMMYNVKSTSEWCRSCDSHQQFCYQYVDHTSSNKSCRIENLNAGNTALLLLLGALSLLLAVFIGFMGYFLWTCVKRMRRRRMASRSDASIEDGYSTGGLSQQSSIGSDSSLRTVTPRGSDIEMLLSPATSPVKLRDTI